MGADFSTAERGASGFRHPLGKHRSGQGQILGQLWTGAVAAAGAAFRVCGGEVAAVNGYHRPEFQIHQRGLAGLVGLAGGLEPLGILGGFLAGAEHGFVDTAGVVAVGKALAVEGGHQRVHHGLGDNPFVQSLAVNGGDGGHVFRPLHPALQLHGDHAHGLHFLQIMHQAVVLQA